MTPKQCPSAPCEAGADLHGIIGPDHQVIRLAKPIKIDATFVEEAFKTGSPTKRFRFSNDCKSSCGFWNGSGCDLAQKARRLAEHTEQPLPKCAIRKSCRWYAQEGAKSCHTCCHVITDMT